MNTSSPITVHFEQPFLERLEQLARLSGKSVAEIVELQTKLQLGWRPPTPPLSPEVQALKGSLPLLQQVDYKTAVTEAILRKYGA
ncbi:ribbon-helix-helix domain-containing protein [Hymenobacter monticola]|uniref:Ribbon-helix-helix domain-containing protein n=1 Tax=Hymenobacter monticola TaxID=1705399 RepID=A0ABY4B4Q0_9BACT|nr:ribbon-helix-helix domain-containing protein [Hymenobacter monticola]UOE34130.1 ribbon-helix-helix domain-containing protein [Hymenobacter monticola]